MQNRHLTLSKKSSLITLFLTLSLLFTACFTSCSAEEKNPYQSYLDLLNQYPDTLGPLGQSSQKEIEIVVDPEQMQKIEQKTGRKVGIVARDKYWLWINDVVKFPNGSLGVYGRVMWLKSLEGTPGVAVMPILPDGRIVLNRNYRHATRSWEYELPRGGVEARETIEDAARREVLEETGMVLSEMIALGSLATDSGLTNGVIPVFAARVVEKKDARPEESEAIAGIEAFTLMEIKQGYIDGYLKVEIDGEVKKIALRDPFLAFALFQAQIRDW